MIFAYIRVSTEKQNTENQRFELQRLAHERNWSIDKWTEETISSMEKLEARKLFTLLNYLRAGDTLLVTELSRLGRNLMQIMPVSYTHLTLPTICSV